MDREIPQEIAGRNVVALRDRAQLAAQRHDPSRAREDRQALESVGHGGVAVDAIEQHPDAAVSSGSVQTPVKVEIRRGERLVEVPQDTIHVRERADEVPPQGMGVNTSLRHDGVDVGALVDPSEVGAPASSER